MYYYRDGLCDDDTRGVWRTISIVHERHGRTYCEIFWRWDGDCAYGRIDMPGWMDLPNVLS